MGKEPFITPSSGAAAGLPQELGMWLQRLETAHPREIELGLDRSAAVARQLGVLSPDAEVVTIGGTNGKGSVAAMVAGLAERTGYHVGVYSSPHFIRFNERIQIAGREARDEDLVEALREVELARQAAGVSLTYFEHTTLAAFWLFQRFGCDLWVLEVGLGGRLDAVNLIDADVAVVTRIAHDHADWLGDDLAGIAREKAGIFRPHRAAIIGQVDAPQELYCAARAQGATPLWRAGREFYSTAPEPGSWEWHCAATAYRGLPVPGILGSGAVDNAASALAAFRQLARAAQLGAKEIGGVLRDVKMTGRLQLVECAGLEWLFDVAHNADGAAELARVLASLPPKANCLALVAVAKRKAAAEIIAAVASEVDRWYLPAIDDPQMYSAVELAERVRLHGGEIASSGADLAATAALIEQEAEPGDRVVVFGSFRTVAAVQQQQGRG